MANLSNINNKFLFTDGDFLKIGNLAPINNISGTESGLSITNSNVASIALDNTAANGKTYVMYSDDGGKLNFYDVDASSGRLVIDSSGNVGIGDASPDSTLSLQNSQSTAANNTTTGSIFQALSPNSGIFMRNRGASAGIGGSSYSTQLFTDSGAGNFEIYNISSTFSLVFGTNATERMRIDSSGVVDITGGILDMGQNRIDGSSDNLKISADNSSVSGSSTIEFLVDADEKMRINNSGNVGIGTIDPSHDLQIGTAATNGSYSMMIEGNFADTALASNPRLNLIDTNFGITAGKYGSGGADDALGIFGFQGAGRGILFAHTTAGSSTHLKDMRHDMFVDGGTGNVGIGTTSPDSKVDIESNHSQLRLTDSDDNKFVLFSYSGGKLIARNNSINTTTNQFTLTQDGKFGIGTISPGTKLVIEGTNDAAGTGVVEIKTTGTNLKIGGNTTYSWIQSHSSKPLYINQLGNNVILNLGGGRVGIGTASPGESLEIFKDGGAIIRLHDPGNNSWKLKADTDFHIYDDSFSDYVTIKNAGQVGIGSTNAASRLEVNGVIQNQNAFDDPTFTVSESGMSKVNGGTLQFTQGFQGTSSSGDTIVFRYNAVSWKSWALDFTFTSTGNGGSKHVCSGNIGGYNNNSTGYTSNFTQNFTTPITVSKTNVGQNNVITFTGNFGIHLMCTMRYSQSGGDGAPTSARASLTYNS
jgi:hypothetical protein